MTREQRQQILREAAEQRYAEFQGGEILRTGGTPLQRTGHPIGDEFYDFYRTLRGEVTPVGASAQTTTMPSITA